ncbi:MAG: pro-sigmaK processing inhibitor BofA family protein [Oscillibacter sp.]|nr:pro-sigmaK processing inhibitor BofA family protein [Oscillibacter sp.]MBQ7682644.1 pro-sigmaK processing inhibitor BofA family protein [Oscillibacter sp.]MBQ9618765.1 pro-sigmaK processing inhibitor BofA family protein [Oscillibacter sp.]
MNELIGVVIIVFLVVALLRLLTAPLRLAVKLAVNAGLGLLALWLVNMLPGVALGLNLVNALIVGIFGLPGLILLILLQWIL